MNTSNTELKIEEFNNIPNKTKMTNKKAIDNVSEKKDLNLNNSNVEKRFHMKKLMDSHIECFKIYLEENSSITPTEAMDRIAKDTGLKVSYSLVQKTLLKLKKELGLVPNINNSIETGTNKYPYGYKFKDVHIECLKRYLEENSTITPTEAMDRIVKDTGLKVSYSLVQKTLLKLKKELGLVPNINNSIETGTNKYPYGYKFKDVYIECLKRYLEENSTITPTEAMDRIVKDTGLEVSYSLVQKTLLKLKKELGLVLDNKDSTNTRTKISPYCVKLNNIHIECLKSYLKENKYITYAQANRRLHEETGLEISLSAIRKAIIILGEELRSEHSNLDPDKLGNNHSRPKLIDEHMEYLKKYLKEDIYIGNTEAMNKLYQDTGLNVSVTKIRFALIKLEQEIKSEEGELSSSDSVSKTASEPWIYGLKLKKLHIECLKKYISENSIISAKKATRRLHNETGLKVSSSTVCRVLAVLKNPNQDSIDPSLPISTSKVRCRTGSYNFKLQNQHIECLKRYLNENNSINLNEAKKKLYNETGLKVTSVTIKNAFLDLKEHANLDKSQPISDTKITFKQWNFGRKLKDNHIECLKKYLNEDNSIGSTIAKNRLHDETGLEISAYPIQLALAKLRKDMSQAGNESQSSTSELSTKARIRGFGYKVKDMHIERLRKYLIEDESISCEVAMNRLIQDTGLKLSKASLYKILSNLKVKSESE